MSVCHKVLLNGWGDHSLYNTSQKCLQVDNSLSLSSLCMTCGSTGHTCCRRLRAYRSPQLHCRIFHTGISEIQERQRYTMQSTKTIKKSSFKRPAFTAPTVKAQRQEILAQEKDTINKDDHQKPGNTNLPTADGAHRVSDDDNQVVPQQPEVSAHGDAGLTGSQKQEPMADSSTVNTVESTSYKSGQPKQKTKPIKKKEFKVTTKPSESLTKKSSVAEKEGPATSEQIPKEKSSETSKEKREKEKTPKESKPVKSLTDAEYDEIFAAVFEYVENINMDEWTPKLTSPVKVREPKKKIFSITVGKNAEAGKDTSNNDQSVESSSNDKKKGLLNNIDNVKKSDKPKKVSKKAKSGTEKNEDYNNLNDDAPKEKQEEAVKAVISKEQIQPDSDINKANDEDLENAKEHEDNEGDDLSLASSNAAEEQNNGEMELNSPNRDEVQLKNEHTPITSEAGKDELPIVHKKNKKVKKREHLEPRKLPFQNPSAAVSVLEQIKQIKAKKVKAGLKAPKSDYETPVSSEKTKFEEKRIKKDKTENGIKIRETKNNSSKKKLSKKLKMLERDLNLEGTWVQCCNSSCLKWRHLPDVNDPASVPENWTCCMNKREEYNSCSKPEESYNESDHIYTKFTEGSVVWAKMTGYPWWPAMVEIDPDTETFFSLEEEDAMTPTHYHVVFFDDHVSRCWVKAQNVLQFSENEEDILYTIPKKFQKEVAAAKKNALRALSCTLQERIELFGFASRFNGTWEHKIGKDKGKKAKKDPKSVTACASEDLDETTIDDVLDNADEILGNVEEIIDSLDSQMDNSDEDPEFEAKELIVIERKRRKTGRNAESKKVKFSSPKEDSVNEEENEVESDGDNCEVDSYVKSDDRVGENGPAKSLKLDPEMFTMDMDQESENEDPVMITEDNNAKQIAEKNSMIQAKKLTTKKTCENKLSPVYRSELSAMDNKAAQLDGKEKAEKESAEGGNLISMKIDEVTSEKEQENCDESSIGDKDLQENGDEDEMDLFGIQPSEQDKTAGQNQDMNFQEDSDSELDLEDQSMYDDNTGDSKMQERSDVHVPIVVHSEAHAGILDDEANDSNPFDLIEE